MHLSSPVTATRCFLSFERVKQEKFESFLVGGESLVFLVGGPSASSSCPSSFDN
jgi:hypothetical protein